MPKLIFEFETNAQRDKFLELFCNGGIEDTMRDTLEMHGVKLRFNYQNAFKAWGWDDKGDPTVICTEYVYLP